MAELPYEFQPADKEYIERLKLELVAWADAHPEELTWEKYLDPDSRIRTLYGGWIHKRQLKIEGYEEIMNYYIEFLRARLHD